MKKAAVFLFLFFAVITIHAADPGFYGNMLSALQESNPRIRAGVIINILENSPEKAGDSTTLTILKDDFSAGAFDRTLFSRMLRLLEKDPENKPLLLFCADTAKEFNTYPEVLSKILRRALKKEFLFELFNENKEVAYTFINAANSNFMNKEDYRGSAQFLNELTRKDNLPPVILYSALHLNIFNCFHAVNTAPGLPGYDQLPADDFWKKSLTELGEKIINIAPANYADANFIVLSALLLQHPKTPELLKKYSAAYPDQEWTNLSISIAVKFKDKKLFIPQKYSFYQNFKGQLAIRDFSEARKTIRHLKGNDRLNLTMMLKGAENNHSEVIRLFNSGNCSFDKLIHPAFYALVSAVHITKNRTLTEKMLDAILTEIAKKNVNDVIMCNSVGYIAADLNIRLTDAEKLIRIAVNAFPEEPSFRDSMAWVLYRQKRFAEAEKEIMIAVKNSNASLSASVIYLHAAAIKHAVNKNDEAKTFLKKARQLYIPGDPECIEYDAEIEKYLEKSLK